MLKTSARNTARLTRNETRLNGNDDLVNVLFAATISRAVASNSNAKTYAKIWHGFAGSLVTLASRTNVLTKFAYRLLSVANHHVGVVVWGAGWCG